MLRNRKEKAQPGEECNMMIVLVGLRVMPVRQAQARVRYSDMWRGSGKASEGNEKLDNMHKV